MNLSRSPKTNLLQSIYQLFELREKSAGFSHLMDVYGRLRVREYNTLHRAIRRSSWGPDRCNIALHLRMETLVILRLS